MHMVSGMLLKQIYLSIKLLFPISAGYPVTTPNLPWSDRCDRIASKGAELILYVDLTICAGTFVLILKIGDYFVEVLEGQSFEDLCLSQRITRNVA